MYETEEVKSCLNCKFASVIGTEYPCNKCDNDYSQFTTNRFGVFLVMCKKALINLVQYVGAGIGIGIGAAAAIETLAFLLK
jgi:hypothetical protein